MNRVKKKNKNIYKKLLTTLNKQFIIQMTKKRISKRKEDLKMKKVNISDVYDLICNLSRQETQNYNDYMRNNPQDTQRTRNHILAQSIYNNILYQFVRLLDQHK